MSTTFETPTTIRELTRYIEREHPDLQPAYNSGFGQVFVSGQPGQAEPSAALREILGSNFETQTVAIRGHWIGVVNAADDGGER